MWRVWPQVAHALPNLLRLMLPMIPALAIVASPLQAAVPKSKHTIRFGSQAFRGCTSWCTEADGNFLTHLCTGCQSLRLLLSPDAPKSCGLRLFQQRDESRIPVHTDLPIQCLYPWSYLCTFTVGTPW